MKNQKNLDTLSAKAKSKPLLKKDVVIENVEKAQKSDPFDMYKNAADKTIGAIFGNK